MDEIIPRLWVGDFACALHYTLLADNKIGYVLSAMRGQFEIDRRLKWLQIPLDDDEEEDVLSYFPQTIDFIRKGLEEGEAEGLGVFVHCQAGMSRSATIVCAYLLQTQGKDVDTTLEMMRKKRPIVCPNDGFYIQLGLFYEAGCKVSRRDKPTRLHYIEKAAQAISNHGGTGSTKLDPRMLASYTPSQAIAATRAGAGTVAQPRRRLRCKMCRRELAAREHLLQHTPDSTRDMPSHASDSLDAVPSSPDPSDAPPDAPDTAGSSSPPQPPHKTTPASSYHGSTFSTPRESLPKGTPGQRAVRVVHGTPDVGERHPLDTSTVDLPPLLNPKCSGYFLEPMAWMEPILEGGSIEGKILCPNTKCGAKLGNYTWVVFQCSCGGWVTPAFCIARTKVDEIT